VYAGTAVARKNFHNVEREERLRREESVEGANGRLGGVGGGDVKVVLKREPDLQDEVERRREEQAGKRCGAVGDWW
jgi:O-acetyl-ADP-ribose deacetylase (regulator of RNase III)